MSKHAVEKYMHLLLICWIISQVGHAVLSIFYEQSPAVFLVSITRLLFVLLIIGAWRRHRWSAKMCAITAIAVIFIQGRFIWCREAYGALSIPVLIFDVLEIAVAILYWYSSSRHSVSAIFLDQRPNPYEGCQGWQARV